MSQPGTLILILTDSQRKIMIERRHVVKYEPCVPSDNTFILFDTGERIQVRHSLDDIALAIGAIELT